MKKSLIILATFALSITMQAQKGKKTATKLPANTKTLATAAVKMPAEGIFATIETEKGKIVLELEYKKTPITVANFISLAEGTNTFAKPELKGKHFYDGLKFHRVIAEFMIQGGDPLGTGSGDPGYKFKDEFTNLVHDKAGILSMANSGPGTNGSQFFITHKETPWLNGKHTIFGHVLSGQNVVNAIAQNDVMKKIIISRKGTEAKSFDAAKVFGTYFANKDNEELQARKKAEDAAKAAKAEYVAKYGAVMTQKVADLAKLRATATKSESGLEYVLTPANGAKPAEGAQIFINYSGYLEDGSLFQSSYEAVSKLYGKFDQNAANNNAYKPFPFKAGTKTGLIPGFLEGLEKMSIGDKMTLFIPAKLGYGERAMGNVIPANSNLIFELEVLDKMPEKN